MMHQLTCGTQSSWEKTSTDKKPHHLLSVIEKVVKSNSSDCVKDEMPFHVTLLETHLWRQFHALTNEMIVTKSGRRMFPVVKINVSNLEPNAMYCVLLEFIQMDNHRWKYVNGEWVPGGKAEVRPTTSDTIYIHPDSPNFGAHWMKEPVLFDRIKLTNKPSGSGQIILNSLHKYEPRIHIIKVEIPSPEKWCSGTFTFPETQFIAVTAYQNEEVTTLKIKHNPYAKAFLDARDRPGAIRDFPIGECPSTSVSPMPQFGSWYERLYPPPAHVNTNPNFNPHCERPFRGQNRNMPYLQPMYRRQSSNQGNSTLSLQSNQSPVYLPTTSSDTWDLTPSHSYPFNPCMMPTSSSTSSQSDQHSFWTIPQCPTSEEIMVNYNETRGSPSMGSARSYSTPEAVDILNEGYDSPSSQRSGEWSPLTPSPTCM